MNDSIDFTIIIPARNESSNIGNCLASIFATNFDRNRYEVLVIDNGSEDQTVQIAKNMGVKVFEKPGLTISGLRNFGARQSKGKILAFLDADCTVDINWLAAASIYLTHDNVVSFGSPAILPKNSTWVQRSWFSIRWKGNQVKEVEWLESANLFVRAEAFSKIGGFNENLITCEDYDLSVRLKTIGKLLADSRIVATHHREPGTIREFFLKEKWRGKSNIVGIFSHGFRLKELPSLGIPIIYLLFMVGVIIGSLYGIFHYSDMHWIKFAASILLWQLPIFLLAFKKVPPPKTTPAVSQLFILLNLYFFARGWALFGGRRR